MEAKLSALMAWFRAVLFPTRSKKRREEEATRQWFLLCGPRPHDLSGAPNPLSLEKLVPPAIVSGRILSFGPQTISSIFFSKSIPTLRAEGESA